MVVLGGGGVKRIYTYRHFSRCLRMYVHTIPFLKLAHSLCPSEQGGGGGGGGGGGRKKRQKRERIERED